MPSVSELVEDVAVLMGEQVETVNAYARALIDAGELPKSRGRAVAQVTHAHIVKLITAVALEPKIKDAAETISHYLSIDSWYVPGRADPNFRSSAGEWLEAMMANILVDAKTEDDKTNWWRVIVQQIAFETSSPEFTVSRPSRGMVIWFKKPDLKTPKTWCKRVVVVSCLGIFFLGSKSGRSYKTGKVGL